MSFSFDNEGIEWVCEGPCGDTLGRNSYVTMVTTSTGEVVKVEKGRVIDMEPQFPVETEYLCFTCYQAKYKDPVKTLRTALVAVTRAIELIEADCITGGLGALEKLNLLVEHIADNLPREEEAIDG